MSVAENFRRNVAAARKAKGMSQTKLAKACGLSASGMQYIETGRRVPSLPSAAAIAAALGVSLDALISNEG